MQICLFMIRSNCNVKIASSPNNLNRFNILFFMSFFLVFIAEIVWNTTSTHVWILFPELRNVLIAGRRIHSPWVHLKLRWKLFWNYFYQGTLGWCPNRSRHAVYESTQKTDIFQEAEQSKQKRKKHYASHTRPSET